MRKLKLYVTALATLTLLSDLAFGAADGRKTYLVQLKGEPAASYQGGVQAWRPLNQRLAPPSPSARPPCRPTSATSASNKTRWQLQ